MRTTVDLDDDVIQVARDLAQEREQSLGRALSDLIRRGLQPEANPGIHRGTVPVLPRKPGGRPVTVQHQG